MVQEENRPTQPPHSVSTDSVHLQNQEPRYQRSRLSREGCSLRLMFIMNRPVRSRTSQMSDRDCESAHLWFQVKAGSMSRCTQRSNSKGLMLIMVAFASLTSTFTPPLNKKCCGYNIVETATCSLTRQGLRTGVDRLEICTHHLALRVKMIPVVTLWNSNGRGSTCLREIT